MAKTEQVILTNMCMVCDGAGNVLVQDRNDPNWPGLTFPGGHVEPGEALTCSVIREIREETGLDIRDVHLCGIKHFHRLDGTRYLVFLYRTDQFSGQLRPSEEGDVFWISETDFDKYTWVPDFADMLRIFRDEFSELYYYRSDGSLKRAYF